GGLVFRVFSGRPCRDSLVDYVYVDYFLLPKGLLNGAV
ncbi:Os07g0436350, partial [Oryza sativa Japonica Group]